MKSLICLIFCFFLGIGVVAQDAPITTFTISVEDAKELTIANQAAQLKAADYNQTQTQLQLLQAQLPVKYKAFQDAQEAWQQKYVAKLPKSVSWESLKDWNEVQNSDGSITWKLKSK